MRATGTMRRSLAAQGLALAICLPLAAQDNPLVQRGVPAEATAADAVAAREAALASARRIAWQRMAEALGGGLPTPSDAQLDRMVAALIVEEERTTATRYMGRLTVQFSAAAVAQATGRSVAPGTGGLNVPTAPTGHVAVQAVHGSLPDWVELRRRLQQSGQVASLEVQEFRMDGARLRLGLRGTPAELAAGLEAAGLAVEREGPVWQVGLAGGR